MKLKPFMLERFFAKHEFSAKYLLCSSDCETISLRELLAMESGSAEQLADLRLGYTESRGDPGLRAELARLYTSIGADDIIVHAGAEEAILNFCMAFLSAGDHVIVNMPCYQSLAEIPASLGCDVSPWTFRENKARWFLDPDELASLARANTRLVIVNSPHNPSGAHLKSDEYEALIDFCAARGIALFVDEVYRFLEPEVGLRLPSACDAYENGFSLNVFSKSAGLAGLRIGWLATRRRDILDAVALVKDYNSICSSGPSELLAKIAARNFEKLAARNRGIIADNLKPLGDFFARHGDFAEWIPPAAGPIAFPRLAGRALAEFGGDARNMVDRLVREAGVLLAPGHYYMADPARFRIGFGRANMPQALSALESWLAAI